MSSSYIMPALAVPDDDVGLFIIIPPRAKK
jgi:hypothetical protein